MSSQQTKQEKRRERREERRLQREAQLRAKRRKQYLVFGGAVVAVVVVLVVGIVFYLSRPTTTGVHSQGANNSINAQSTPTLPPLSALAVNNIDCSSSEQLTYHVHTHLSLYVNGSLVTIPANIGVDNSNGCYYWMHTHDASGAIHIEAPQQGTYTLGTFFRLWDQRFSQLGYPQQLKQVAGWKVYVNGKPYSGDFHNIALNAHTLITMAYNTPHVQPDTVFNWNGM